ncbi:hypothetical protein H5T58_00835 [Candidatus Parcubacteria bacterium]|nr:hypothetical protein [Candidatus Parcubacteria bacterium]
MKKGVTLYLTILILLLISALTVFLSELITIPLQTTRELPFVVQALHAADSGVERALYEIYVTQGGTVSDQQIEESLSQSQSEPRYKVFILQYGHNMGDYSCPSRPTRQWYCIFSTGTYRGAQRYVEASY